MLHAAVDGHPDAGRMVDPTTRSRVGLRPHLRVIEIIGCIGQRRIQLGEPDVGLIR